MKQNIKVILSYDGTRYFGWQKTKMGPSIEEILQYSLEKILKHPIKLQAASRTDRGVHAQGQVVNFFRENLSLELSKLQRALQGLVPKDISIRTLEFAPECFHPTLDCLGKEYHYQICNTEVQVPFHRDFSWHIHLPLNVELMRQGGQILIGTHDFSAFSNIRMKNSIRTVEEISIIEHPDKRILISVKGENFLYKMVRNLVGTLVYIGLEKIPLSQLQEILLSKQRALAGITAPAHGLCLKEVFY